MLFSFSTVTDRYVLVSEVGQGLLSQVYRKADGRMIDFVLATDEDRASKQDLARVLGECLSPLRAAAAEIFGKLDNRGVFSRGTMLQAPDFETARKLDAILEKVDPRLWSEKDYLFAPGVPFVEAAAKEGGSIFDIYVRAVRAAAAALAKAPIGDLLMSDLDSLIFNSMVDMRTSPETVEEIRTLALARCAIDKEMELETDPEAYLRKLADIVKPQAPAMRP